MIKGSYISATNTEVVGSGTACLNIITIPTGKTFVLTDLIVGMGTAGSETPTGIGSLAPLGLWDYVGTGTTSGTDDTTRQMKLCVNVPAIQATTADNATTLFVPTGMVLKFPLGGPEFTTGVTAQKLHSKISTGGLFIAGVLR